MLDRVLSVCLMLLLSFGCEVRALSAHLIPRSTNQPHLLERLKDFKCRDHKRIKLAKEGVQDVERIGQGSRTHKLCCLSSDQRRNDGTLVRYMCNTCMLFCVFCIASAYLINFTYIHCATQMITVTIGVTPHLTG